MRVAFANNYNLDMRGGKWNFAMFDCKLETELQMPEAEE